MRNTNAERGYNEYSELNYTGGERLLSQMRNGTIARAKAFAVASSYSFHLECHFLEDGNPFPLGISLIRLVAS